ncbi:PAS domain-containing protein [Noviherbaspirillum sp. CPCC 100848]|uniref:histidine kinase n=1 Tax=Noviherbaspirillum album TaxID=3080276 RepID=A0ABU6J7W7_9BURK|nr:PAS domain-containing protein [Noviherbaspirillum sp. CPCC 100848]MEC4719538.1 PAS domain-containing protein [Noviherbaspirillum sp. CPCC 100848]
MHAQTRFRDMVDRCAESVFIVHHGVIAGCNAEARRVFGTPGGDALAGRALGEVLHDADDADLPVLPERLQEESVRCRLLSSGGTVMDAEISIMPCHDAAGSIEAGIAGAMLVCIRDAGAHQSLSAALFEQDQYLKLITDTAPLLISYVGPDERYRFVNLAYQQWFGHAREDIIGRSVREVVGDAYDMLQGHVQRALAGHAARFELDLATLAGERHVIAIYTPDLRGDGSVAGFSAVITDITERSKGEKALREREQQLRLITDSLPVFIAQCDRDYYLHFVNKTYADRFGFDPADVIGKRIPDIIGDEAFANLRQYMDATLRGEPQEHELGIPMADGSEHYMQLMYVPEYDADGEVVGLVAAISDISRLRDTEEKLQRRELEFKTLVENSPDIISRIDREMRHLYVNPSIEKLFTLPHQAYIGKTKSELGLPEDIVHCWDDAARKAFDSGQEQRLEFQQADELQTRYFSGRVIPEIDRWGQIESVICIAYDVTERARMEKERDELLARERAARIQAETAARARDEFLAIISHELRAPLNGIQSWAHVLENYVKDAIEIPLAQRALQGIRTGINQQVRLIEDLLDVTRMMSGRLRLVKQPMALLPALRSAVESVESAAAAKRIQLSCNYRITSEQIEGDEDRIKQIFWNLLSNAIKFTPEGGRVWLTATQADKQICVAVSDNGAGVSPEYLPNLFNRFSQRDTSSTRVHNGLGLGLFLVRNLVELHDGSVTAESEGEGKGTTFSVVFPVRVRNETYLTVGPHDMGAGHLPLPSLEGKTVLLIDDQEEARESLTVVLDAAGAEVFAAATFGQAAEWLASRAPGEYPNVLISDIAMPGEDGYAVLRRIRAWSAADGSRPLQRIPALALTAFAQREDRIRALTAGFQMHVTKPVAPEELIIVIDTLASRD